MGIWNLIRRDEPTVDETRAALREARRGTARGDAGAVTRLVETFRDIGLDGKFTFASAGRVAARAKGRHRPTGQAITKVVRRHTYGVGVGGFVTGLGGFLTLAVALPVNVVEFHLQAIRMVGAIARLNGYDLNDDRVRTAVLLTVAGDDSHEILRQAGLGSVSGHIADELSGRIPPGALMLVNKAVGFQLLRRFAESSLLRLGRAVPAFGGLIGAAYDIRQLRRIAAAARRDFPPLIEQR